MDFLWEEIGSITKPQNSFRNKDIISIGVDMNNKLAYISNLTKKKKKLFNMKITYIKLKQKIT